MLVDRTEDPQGATVVDYEREACGGVRGQDSNKKCQEAHQHDCQ